MDSGFTMAHALPAFAYSMKGQHDAAVAEFQQLGGLLDESVRLAHLGYAYGAAGRGTARAQTADLALEENLRPAFQP